MTVAHERGELGAGRLARVHDDDVKREVGNGLCGVAYPALDATP